MRKWLDKAAWRDFSGLERGDRREWRRGPGMAGPGREARMPGRTTWRNRG